MTKKLTIPCQANGGAKPLDFFIGDPDKKSHPIAHQMKFYSKNYGVSVPPEVIDALEKLRTLALNNGVKFEALCHYAIQQNNQTE